MQTETTAIPLIHTKLHRPRVPLDILPRARLLERIDRGRSRPLTLISAAAGYGKSTLASRWLEVCDCPHAWISLDKHDNDLRLFLCYFVKAVGAMFSSGVEKTQSLLDAPNLPPLSSLVSTLLNDLNAIGEDFILVLDDYHRIHETAIHDLIAALLQHPPRAMHLVVLTRRDPPLPLIRLRARRQMNEVTMEQLRFTPSETAVFLEKALEVSVDDAAAAVFEEKVEGWVTGLRLAALSVRGQKDMDSLVSGLRKGFHYITDYLVSEVISRQPPAVAQYMMETAILDRFCPALCEAIHVSGEERGEDQTSGHGFIESLDKAHLFVISLDEQHLWFRYHHLFQDLLQRQLKRRRSSEEIATLHSRASEWFDSHGLMQESIQHALAAGDVVRAAEIVERHRHVEFNQDRWHVVERWMNLLPPEVIRQRPALLLTRAWLLFNHFRLLEIPPILEQVNSLLADDTANDSLLGELDFHRGYLAIWLEGDGAGALERLENVRSRLPEEQQILHVEAEFDLALARHMTGEGKLALQSLEESLRTKTLLDDMMLSRLVGAQVFLYLMSGDLVSALPAARRLSSMVKKGPNNDILAWSAYLQALPQLQAYRLDEALQGFLLAAELRDVLHRKGAVDALAGLVLTYRAMQRTDDAVDARRQLLAFAQATADPRHIEVAESCRARLALLLGDLKSANRWAESFHAEPHVPSALFWLEVPLITQARIQIAAGTPEGLARALESLESLRRKGAAVHFTCLTIEILVLESVALEKQGRTDDALEALKEVLSLAGPGGWIRPFVEAGPPMADMLQQLHKQNVAVDYIEKLLAAFRGDEQVAFQDISGPQAAPTPSVSPQPLIEPLTNRELELLELLAQYRQNKEIAEQLFISTETVKSHLKNIYGKLNVTNRREAVTRARSLGIILPR